MKKAYMTLTGARNLEGFWRMSPAELMSWCDAFSERHEFADDMEAGREYED